MIDWQQLILDMNGLGISCVGIAKRTGAAENTIRGLKGGYWNEPRYSLGAKLLAMHKLHCPEKHKEVACLN